MAASFSSAVGGALRRASAVPGRVPGGAAALGVCRADRGGHGARKTYTKRRPWGQGYNTSNNISGLASSTGSFSRPFAPPLVDMLEITFHDCAVILPHALAKKRHMESSGGDEIGYASESPSWAHGVVW